MTTNECATSMVLTRRRWSCRELGTCAKTTQFHVANLLDKLGAPNRTDVVRVVYARRLIDV